MDKLAQLLELGHDHFGSGSRNSPEFNTFFRNFKREFTKELKSIGATKIEFSKGHFYLSGFFTAESGQIIYFSLPDVRHSIGGGSRSLLFRTAKDYKDFTGGMNQYQPIRSGMASEMLRSYTLG